MRLKGAVVLGPGSQLPGGRQGPAQSHRWVPSPLQPKAVPARRVSRSWEGTVTAPQNGL